MRLDLAEVQSASSYFKLIVAAVFASSDCVPGGFDAVPQFFDRLEIALV